MKFVSVVLAFAAALVFTASAHALDFAQPGGPWQAGSSDLQGLAIGDVNEDGRDDAVTVNYSPNTFSVMLAGSTGALGAPSNRAISAVPYSVTLGDLNNDGHLDVIAAGNDTLMVFLGNGDGTFGAEKTSVATGFDGIAVAVGQFNGNTNRDVVMGDYDGNEVGLFYGNGAGDLVFSGQSMAGQKPVAITVGDFDGNGIDDFASANSGSFFTGAITVGLGSVAGGFSAGPGSPLDGDYQPRGITSADFNGDGDLDLAVVNSPNSGLSVKLGDGNGGFADAPNLPSIPSHWGEPIASADFDGDGYDDFGAGWSTSTSGEQDDSTGIFLGSATGSMSSGGVVPNTSPSYPWYMATGDFNGDGRPDYANADLSGRVSVFINAVPGIEVDPASHDFGNVRVGQGANQGNPLTVTVKASGSLPLEVGSIGLTGTDADQFSIVSDDCGDETIQPGGHCEIVLRFLPTELGPATAQLSIASDATGQPETVALTGNGTPFAYPQFDPEELDFGQVRLGTGPSPSRTVTITAGGLTPLYIESMTIYHANFADFSYTEDECSGETLQAGESCDVAVDFEPGALGDRFALLRLDHPGGVAIVQVMGEGVGDPDFSVDPTSHDFGTRLTDAGFGEPVPFTLTNDGEGPGTVASVVPTGSGADAYRVTDDGCSGQTMAPQTSCTVNVEFGPTAAGEKNASLDFDLGQLDGTVAAALTGSGQDPVPPPNPCEPVTVKRIAYFTPSVKKKSMYPGVRARIETEKPAVVRLSSKVIYRVKGKQRSFKSGPRQLNIRRDFVNYKVAVPRNLRKGLKPKTPVRFVISYASKANDPECTKFGTDSTRSLSTRIVWIRPN